MTKQIELSKKVRDFNRILKELGLYTLWCKCRKEYIKKYETVEKHKKIYHFVDTFESFGNMFSVGTKCRKKLNNDIYNSLRGCYYTPHKILTSTIILEDLKRNITL